MKNLVWIKQSRGMSLIELMVVLAIMGVLAALAYPSYMQHMSRRDRVQAITALLEAQVFMERYYAMNQRYSLDSNGLTAPVLPTRLQATPSLDAPRYLTQVQATLNSYTLTAVPQQAGTSWCDQISLTLTHTGLKSGLMPDGATPAGDVATCWR